jgi:hypothetical protein
MCRKDVIVSNPRRTCCSMDGVSSADRPNVPSLVSASPAPEVVLLSAPDSAEKTLTTDRLPDHTLSYSEAATCHRVALVVGRGAAVAAARVGTPATPWRSPHTHVDTPSMACVSDHAPPSFVSGSPLSPATAFPPAATRHVQGGTGAVPAPDS